MSTFTPQELSLAQYFSMHTLTAQSKEELASKLKGIDRDLEESAEVRLIEA
jgi:hypothetical protein